ncbi:cell wall-binding repeat-containing protein [Herbiconiux sp. P16]|uniref:cell wall-binding repeat-containing protein n=1 Tax=Herbiconiux wuyangfengii TaxID=3342794 RepID=UPI0035B88038
MPRPPIVSVLPPARRRGASGRRRTGLVGVAVVALVASLFTAAPAFAATEPVAPVAPVATEAPATSETADPAEAPDPVETAPPASTPTAPEPEQSPQPEDAEPAPALSPSPAPAPAERRAAPACATVTASPFGAAAGTAGEVTDESTACFTFTPTTRGQYLPWFARAATWWISYEVTDAANGVVCSESWYSSQFRPCQLAAGVPYTFTVTGNPGLDSGEFDLSVYNITAPTGCRAIDVSSWATAATTGSIDAAHPAVCHDYSVSNGTPMHTLYGGSDEGVTAVQFDATGSTACVLSSYEQTSCSTVGAGKTRVLLFTENPDAVDYSLRVTSQKSDSGCDALPDLAFGTDGAAQADAAGALSTPCFSFGLARFETVLVGVHPDSGHDLYADWSLYSPTGEEVCSDAYDDENHVCSAAVAGSYRLVVRNTSSVDEAEKLFSVSVRSVTDRPGCASVSSLGFDAPAKTGTIAGAGEIDCFILPATTGDILRIDPGNPSGEVRARVFDKTGNEVCNAVSSTDCTLSGTAPFAVMLESARGAGQPAYRLTVPRLNGATGCAALPPTAFGAVPATRAGFSENATTKCFSMTSVIANSVDYFGVQQRTGDDSWLSYDVIRPDGAVDCSLESWETATVCAYSTAGTFTLVLRGDGSGTTNWAVGRTPLGESTADCRDLGALAFNAAPVQASISAIGEVDCHVFGVRASDQISGLLRSLSAGSGFGYSVIDGEGRLICEYSSVDEGCTISGAGPFRLLLRTVAGSPAGDYLLRLHKLNDPAGCTRIDSVGFGFGPIEAEFTQPEQQHCYSFTGATGDQFDAVASNLDLPGNDPSVWMLGPSGDRICWLGAWAESPACTLGANGTYAVVVSADSSTLGRYSLRSSCVNPACGADGFSVGAVAPASAGVGAQVTLSISGKALSLADTVTLQRLGKSIVATAVSVSPDRRTLGVTVDLAGASIGKWDLVVTSATGPTVRKSAVFTTESIEPAAVNLELLTQGRFVSGRPQTVTVTYENTGNVDALGVPIILQGFPAGSEIVPDFDLVGWDTADSSVHEVGWTQQGMAYSGEGGLGIPLTISSIPAGATGQLDFTVTVPAAADYDLTASLSGCMFDNGPAPALNVTSQGFQRTNWGTWGSGGCMDALVDVGMSGLGLVPGVGCTKQLLANSALAISRNIVQKAPPFSASSSAEMFQSFIETTTCAVPVLGTVVGIFGAVKSLVNAGTKCFTDDATAPNQWVTSMDPNEIVGPGGGGENHATRAEGAFTYAIYFENRSDATAPAQEVRITDQLDPSVFDLSTLRFGAVEFGTTRFAPGAGATTLDAVLDLRDTANVNLDVNASVDADGTVTWELLSLDPLTGELPQNPDQGFLPPNVDGSEGQGVVYVTVTPRSVTSGQIISNTASIVFDLNEPIVTNTWKNLVDRDRPTVSVKALPAKTAGSAVALSWSGTDGTSAVDHYEIYVAVDGGDYALAAGDVAGTTFSFAGEVGKHYAFVVSAVDQAANLSAFPSKPHAVTTTGPVSPPPLTVDRISGTDRFAVAVAVSKAAFADRAPVVYVATGANYPDALSAGPAAVKEGGPLLLTDGTALPAAVKAEIQRLKPSKIVVVGGVNSVSAAVFTQLKALQPNVVRVAGADRYEASRNLVEYAFGASGADLAYVATGANFPDALSAGGAGGSQDAPVLLVPGNQGTIDGPTKALLGDLGVDSIIIAGGPNSVSEGIRSALGTIAPTERQAGPDRYAASASINAAAYQSSDRVFLAVGTKFPDALAGSAWAGKLRAPLFVVPGDCVPQAVLAQLTALGSSRVTLLGGPASLTPAVENLEGCSF